jgi:hypothetical protein
MVRRRCITQARLAHWRAAASFRSRRDSSPSARSSSTPCATWT